MCRRLRMNGAFESAKSASKTDKTRYIRELRGVWRTRTGTEKPPEIQKKVRARDGLETHQTRSRPGRFGAAGRPRAHKLDVSTHADPPLPKLDTFLRLTDKTFASFSSN